MLLDVGNFTLCVFGKNCRPVFFLKKLWPRKISASLFLGRGKFIIKFLILQFKDLYRLYLVGTFESFCDLLPDAWFADDDLVYPHVFPNVL